MLTNNSSQRGKGTVGQEQPGTAGPRKGFWARPGGIRVLPIHGKAEEWHSRKATAHAKVWCQGWVRHVCEIVRMEVIWASTLWRIWLARKEGSAGLGANLVQRLRSLNFFSWRQKGAHRGREHQGGKATLTKKSSHSWTVVTSALSFWPAAQQEHGSVNQWRSWKAHEAGRSTVPRAQRPCCWFVPSIPQIPLVTSLPRPTAPEPACCGSWQLTLCRSSQLHVQWHQVDSLNLAWRKYSYHGNH